MTDQNETASEHLDDAASSGKAKIAASEPFLRVYSPPGRQSSLVMKSHVRSLVPACAAPVGTMSVVH